MSDLYRIIKQRQDSTENLEGIIRPNFLAFNTTTSEIYYSADGASFVKFQNSDEIQSILSQYATVSTLSDYELKSRLNSDYQTKCNQILGSSEDLSHGPANRIGKLYFCTDSNDYKLHLIIGGSAEEGWQIADFYTTSSVYTQSEVDSLLATQRASLKSEISSIIGPSGAISVRAAHSMGMGAANGNQDVQPGTSDQWSLHLTSISPDGDLQLKTGKSEISTVCPQAPSGTGIHYRFVIYKWQGFDDAGTVLPAKLLAYTVQGEMPITSSWLKLKIDWVNTTCDNGCMLAAGRYYIGILWNGNGARFSGVNGANLNVLPYTSFYKTNMGRFDGGQTIPLTVNFESESPIHHFFRVLAE